MVVVLLRTVILSVLLLFADAFAQTTDEEPIIYVYEMRGFSGLRDSDIYQAMDLASRYLELPANYPQYIVILHNQQAPVMGYYCEVGLATSNPNMCPQSSLVVLFAEPIQTAALVFRGDIRLVYVAVLTHELMHHLLSLEGVPVELHHQIIVPLEHKYYEELKLDHSWFRESHQSR